MTGHATLPCEVYTFIFDNDWAWSVGVVIWMQGRHTGGCRINLGQIKILGLNSPLINDNAVQPTKLLWYIKW